MYNRQDSRASESTRNAPMNLALGGLDHGNKGLKRPALKEEQRPDLRRTKANKVDCEMGNSHANPKKPVPPASEAVRSQTTPRG